MKLNYSTKPTFIYCLTALFLFSSSTLFAQVNTWTQKANFGGTARLDAVGFSIGNKGYIGTGTLVYNDNGTKDFWEYDPETNVWTQKADFGGTGRFAAVGFSIGNKGYIGTGLSDYNNTRTKDFWEYDPGTNMWTQKADFGGTMRSEAVGFSIGTKGYIGAGNEGAPLNNQDFWEYDPGTNMWTQKADFGGKKRSYDVGFSIGTKGYIEAGTNGPSYSINTQDFWEYDPGTDIWTQKADIGGTERSGAVGFSIGNKGYIGTGLLNDKEFWEYDPGTNLWTQKADFGGTGRSGAVGFSIGTNGYIGCGADNAVILFSPFQNDFWEYSTNKALPVSLISFDVKKDIHVNELHWQTSGEINVDHYLIEHSSDGIKFSGLDKVDATGNNQLTKNYSYTDQNPFQGTTFYRLKMVDKDGAFTYSKIVAVKNDDSKKLQIFPNPAKDILYVQASGENENAVIQIVDLTGKKVKEQKIFLNGNTSLSIDISNLPKSIYNLISKRETKTEQQKFVK
jgi:hypothetical protein